MKGRVNAVTIFVFGLCAGSFILLPTVLDFTLTPRFTTLAITLFITLGLLFFQKVKPILKPDYIVLCYALYIVYGTISIMWAKNLAEAFFEASRQCLAFTVFFTGYYFFKQNPKAIWKVLDKFCVLIVFAGLAVALYQYSGIKKVDKDLIYLITGLNGHKNLYASFLFLNLFFLIRAYFTNSGFFKILIVLAIVISVLVLLFLRTKAVFISLAITVLITAALWGYVKIKKTFKINAVIVVLFCLVIANIFFLMLLKPIIDKGLKHNSEIISGIDKTKTELDNERLVLWQKSFDMYKKHPLIGVGAGNWQIFFPDATLKGLWRAEDLNYTFQRPHNDLLWILCEYGIIGFNFFLAFLLLLLTWLVKVVKEVEGFNNSFEIIICFAFIVGYLTISFFDFPKERIEHLIWINLIFAIAYSNIKKYGGVKSLFTFQLNRPAIVSGLAVLFFIVTIGILRYQGEFFTRKMYDAKNNAIYSEVIRLGTKAQSFAYTIDPTSIPINWYTGNARVLMNQPGDALKDFEKAYSFNPYNRNVINDLASANAMNNNIERATSLYIETARISPRFDEAKLNLTALYIQQKKYKEALNCLDSIYHDSDRRKNYTNMVEAFISQEKKEK